MVEIIPKQQQEKCEWEQFEGDIEQNLLDKLMEQFQQTTKLQRDVFDFFFDAERKQLKEKEMGAFVIAPAGNGKTLCFLIPALQSIDFTKPLVNTTQERKKYKGQLQEFAFHVFLPQVVIIVDTQSLVDQIEIVIKQLLPPDGPYKDIKVQKLYKDINLHEQFDEKGQIRGCHMQNLFQNSKCLYKHIKKQTFLIVIDQILHILISTPNLLCSKVTFEQKNPKYPTRVSLDNCNFLAIDEAEQVIGQNESEIKLLIQGNEKLRNAGIYGARENPNLNVCLTSATLDRRSRESFRMLWYQDTAFRVFSIELKLDGVFPYCKQLKTDKIDEAFDEVITILRIMFMEKKLDTQVMIFLDEIQKIRDFEPKLKATVGDAIKYNSYHSQQENRNQILESFRKGDFQVLFTTNVLARGIDIRKVSLVINLYAPRDKRFANGKPVFYLFPKIYMHRVGRTGRFADQGVAITLLKGQDPEFDLQDNQLEEKLIDFVVNFKVQDKTYNQGKDMNERKNIQDNLRKEIKEEVIKSGNLKMTMVDDYSQMLERVEKVMENNRDNKEDKKVVIKQEKETTGDVQQLGKEEFKQDDL